MKKILSVCAFLALLCQSSFAASPLLASVIPDRSVPDAGSTMAMLAVGLTGLAMLARKMKK